MCSADGSMVSCHNAKIFRVLLRPIVGKASHEPVGGECVVYRNFEAKHFLKSAQKGTCSREPNERRCRKDRTEDR